MTDDEAIALLEESIKATGLSDRRFAVEVLIRDERTLRRWLARENPVPEVVREFLSAWKANGFKPFKVPPKT